MILWLYVFMIFIVFYCRGHGLQIRAIGRGARASEEQICTQFFKYI